MSDLPATWVCRAGVRIPIPVGSTVKPFIACKAPYRNKQGPRGLPKK